ncbi:MAG: hypothetical protein ACR2IP_03470 [Solirubrobacteraceae bacterium]
MSRAAEPELRIRDASGVEHGLPLAQARLDVLATAAPWRAFRSHRGQPHFPGLYWSSTTRGHVGYESRLELARLLLADFDVAVRGIISQPFLLTAVSTVGRGGMSPTFCWCWTTAGRGL